MLPILPAALHWARPADTGPASALPQCKDEEAVPTNALPFQQ